MISRSTTKNIWLLAMALSLGGAFFTYRQAEVLQAQTQSQEEQRRKLSLELRAGNLHTAAMIDLDNFTINERDATTLNILRHLDLEESNLTYRTTTRTQRKIGGTNLYTRRFVLNGKMSYQEALAQADWLHDTNKVTINKISLKPASGREDSSNHVQLDIEGTLYGLDKTN